MLGKKSYYQRFGMSFPLSLPKQETVFVVFITVDTNGEGREDFIQPIFP